jgi:hypothetical protein
MRKAVFSSVLMYSSDVADGDALADEEMSDVEMLGSTVRSRVLGDANAAWLSSKIFVAP